MKRTFTNSLKNESLRYSEYYGMTDVTDSLYDKSLKGENFLHIMKFIKSKENILLAFRSLKRNNGSRTPGVDGVTMKDIEKIGQNEFLQIVRQRLNNFQPRKIKRVEIPKPNGKTRPLGIPSIWDRIIQQCILQIMEPICEAKFNKHSYGFRPNRSCENAIQDCSQRINRSKMQFVVDIDIEGFFDEVSHTKLMRQIWTMGIRDKQLLVILRKMLKAPVVLDDGNTLFPTKGTPQGGVLSPLLANINLNEFDWWIANQWEERNCVELKPHIREGNRQDKNNMYVKMRKSTRLKEIYLVRYCDDFKLFCKTREIAEKIFLASKMWLEERLKLPISEEKSRITNLKKSSSEFLGFTLKLKRFGKIKGKSRFVMHSHISNKALKRIRKNLKDQVKNIKHKLNSHQAIVEINKYNSMVIGIHNYYKIATQINGDLNRLQFDLLRAMYNRFPRATPSKKVSNAFCKQGTYTGKDKGIIPYLKSDMIRYLMKRPILPIGYVKTVKPMNVKRNISKFTPEGRKLIHHRQQVVSEKDLKWLRDYPILGKRGTVELNDNRLSKYVAQRGKCAVTGEELNLLNMHCHHIKLWAITKDDSYQNLVLVTEIVHRLIHVVNIELIETHLKNINLNEKGFIKLNTLRKQIGLAPIREN